MPLVEAYLLSMVASLELIKATWLIKTVSSRLWGLSALKPSLRGFAGQETKHSLICLRNLLNRIMAILLNQLENMIARVKKLLTMLKNLRGPRWKRWNDLFRKWKRTLLRRDALLVSTDTIIINLTTELTVRKIPDSSGSWRPIKKYWNKFRIIWYRSKLMRSGTSRFLILLAIWGILKYTRLDMRKRHTTVELYKMILKLTLMGKWKRSKPTKS